MGNMALESSSMNDQEQEIDTKDKKQLLPPIKNYTKKEVQQHNDKNNDFWIIVNTGKYYGVYDITSMARDPSSHPGPVEKFLMGFNEAKSNSDNGNDVSKLMGSGTIQSHSWYKWPTKDNRKEYDMIFMGICSDP